MSYAGLVDEEDLRLIATIPSICEVNGTAILAEIGDVKHFDGGKNLFPERGLLPQSTSRRGKTLTGSITKKNASGLGLLWFR